MPSTPEIKTLKPVTFLFHRMQTTIANLQEAIPVGQQLIREAIESKLFVTGCVHWHYFGFDGDESKPFTLEVALPIAPAENYSGKFSIKRTTDFKAVCLTHEGAWTDIPKSYGRIMAFMENEHLKPGSESREAYVNADFNYAEANITEIQVGLR
jgi:effector-binding domain-containing protein